MNKILGVFGLVIMVGCSGTIGIFSRTLVDLENANKTLAEVNKQLECNNKFMEVPKAHWQNIAKGEYKMSKICVESKMTEWFDRCRNDSKI